MCTSAPFHYKQLRNFLHSYLSRSLSSAYQCKSMPLFLLLGKPDIHIRIPTHQHVILIFSFSCAEPSCLIPHRVFLALGLQFHKPQQLVFAPLQYWSRKQTLITEFFGFNDYLTLIGKGITSFRAKNSSQVQIPTRET